MPATWCIETDGLTRRFGDVAAVTDVDLHVPERCVYGFLGPNGAGKTTTIRMLLGLVQPDSGSVRLFGQAFTRRDWPMLAQVGALVESPSLYPHLTGRENLEVTRRMTNGPRARFDSVLQTVGLADAADRRVRTYSAGMRQRLGLALALLGEPKLLILDEPTNGLDSAGVTEMRSFLRRLPEESGVTVFLSSHLLPEAELTCSHIGIINLGRMVFQGPIESLRQQVASQLRIGSNRPDEARQVLAGAGWTAGVEADQLVLPVNTRADAAAVNRLLMGAGLDVYNLHLCQPSLEDMLLQLTRPQ